MHAPQRIALGLAACAWSLLPVHAQEDAPEEEPPRGLRSRAEGAFEGYTLISPLSSHAVLLLDMAGEVVHRWETQHAPSGSPYLLEDGTLLRAGIQRDNPRFHGGGIGGRVQKFSWDGELLWDYELASDYQTQHHDLEPLPNGNVLVIVWEHRFADDVLAAGRDPRVVNDEGLWPDAVLELRPVPPEGAEVVWEWHSWDHLIQDRDPELAFHGSIPDHPEKIDVDADHRDRPPMTVEEKRRLEARERQMRALGYVGDDEEDEDAGTRERGKELDWLHTNSVDYHPEYDLIALSTPHLNEIWIIDHSTSTEEAAWDAGGRWGRGGDLLYRWGNPRNYGAGTDADRALFYQHNVDFVPGVTPDELRVTIFNNGGGRPGGDVSTVEELVLPFDPQRGFTREEGEPYGPEEPTWSWALPEDAFSAFISGAQRLPNGNTLVCAGAPGRLLEVTRAGVIVWDYLNPFGGDAPSNPQGGGAPTHALFRATRIAPDHPGLAGRFTAGEGSSGR